MRNSNKKFNKRNLVATNPIMKKGGFHGKSSKAIRRAEHQALKSGALNQDGGGFVSNSQHFRCPIGRLC